MARKASRTTLIQKDDSYTVKQLSVGRRGFTIVELLIVVVVIAILAAITIVSYNGIQNRAKASAAQSTATQAYTKIESYAALNADNYPDDLATIGLNNTDSVNYQYRVDNTTTPRTYCVTATTNGLSYFAANGSGSTSAGACAGHGANGVTPITNLVVNPSAEIDTTSASSNGSASSVTRDTSWAAEGSASFLVAATSSSSNDSYMNIGGGDQFGGLRAGLQAGKTYTISGTVRLSAPLTGGSIRAQALKIVAYQKTGGSISGTESAQAPNVAGQTRLSVTMTIPSGATEAWIRFYNGAMSGGGNVWWDGLMITEGTTTYKYADGTSPGWFWKSTAHNSTSSGPPLP